MPVTIPEWNEGDRAEYEQMHTIREPYRRLAECIDATLGAQYAIDIGCGVGFVTERLHELGWQIVGCDFSPIARELKAPGFSMHLADVTRRWESDAQFDVAICTEVAEHVPVEHANTLVDNIAMTARAMIVFSASDAEWPGHVNRQPIAYWHEKFAARGWYVDELLTSTLRENILARHAQHEGATGNFAVLVKK